MFPRSISLAISIVAAGIILIFGCSSGQNPIEPVPADDHQNSPSMAAENQVVPGDGGSHYLMQYNMIYVDPTDPDNPIFEVVPVRATSIHLNILKLLEVGPCTDCFKITGLVKIEPLHFTVDIEITHPLADPIFTVFDCRAIIMFNGSRTFPESGLVCSDNTMGDTEFLDPDGYTALYNSETLGIAPNDFFGYFQGEIATPELPGATLNGYRRYIIDDPANTRNALYDGDTVTNSIEMMFGPNPFALGYAVDACWAPPIHEPVDDPMTDFGPESNCEEPWRVEVLESGFGLTEFGGSTTLQIDVSDWDGKTTHGDPVIECPELFSGTRTATWVSDGADYSTYEVTISNENLAPIGNYKVLVGIEANENDPVAAPWLDLTAYQILTVEVNVEGAINFPDPNLELAVRNAISKPTGDIYQSDLNGLTTLAAGGMSISNLEGIQYCVDLENLGLGGNLITSIGQLASLNGLTNLGLGSNQIADVTPLQGLVNLTDLEIDDNQVTDLTPLQNLTNLIDLEVDFNQITDVTPIVWLVNLSQLNLSSNQITDIGPIAGTPPGFGTGVEIWLDYNPLDCDSINVDIPALQANGVIVNYIEPEILFPDPGLDAAVRTALILGPTDPIYQSQLCTLTFLSAMSASITNLEGIQYCENLDQLELMLNSISDITLLQNLSSLTGLWLNGNQIANVTPLQNLTNLTILDLDTNLVNDITPLQGLTGLIRLTISNNTVSDLTAIQNYTSLTHLIADTTLISDITPLQNLTTITNLELNENQIVDLTPLQNLTNLHFFSLENNLIVDVYPLTLNPGLGAGDILWIDNNPLNCDSYGVYIPILQGNGVTVHFNDHEITFPDPGLDTAIRSVLGLAPADPILKGDLCTLTLLLAGGLSISNLEGIQECSNLEQLELFDNSLTDISQLHFLTHLTHLWMWNNQISDIGPLEELTNLTWLHLADNNIVDISPVQFLVNLDRIEIQNNIGIINAEPLWNCHLAGGLQAGSDVFVNGTGLVPGDTWLDLLIAAGVNVVY